MYQPPNNNPSEFISTTNTIVSKAINEKKEIILGMDHNKDLLKSGNHHSTRKFLEDLTDKNVMPTITHPTCIMHNTATLIDNIFVSKNL